MKVLTRSTNKQNYTEEDIRQFVHLYHLDVVSPRDDPVLTTIIADQLHIQNTKPHDAKPLNIWRKMAKFAFSFLFVFVFLSLTGFLLYKASTIEKKLIIFNCNS